MIPDHLRSTRSERAVGGVVLLGIVLGALLSVRLASVGRPGGARDFLALVVVLAVALLLLAGVLALAGLGLRNSLGRTGPSKLAPAKGAFLLACLALGVAFSVLTFRLLFDGSG